MEMLLVIVSLVAVYGGMILIGLFFSWLGSLSDKHKEKIRNQALEDIQKEINLQSIIEEYKGKLKDINYERAVSATDIYIKKYSQERNVKLIGEFGNFLSDCPRCKTGKLVARKGIHGNFIGCSKYPSCKYTENVKIAKTEYKRIVGEQIIKDIQEAYS